MQTFLPLPGLARSAALLDDRRLGKQRVETLQIVRALTRETYGWKRHPAVRMWEGHVPALARYGLAVVEEWLARGHLDTVAATLRHDLALAGLDEPAAEGAVDLPAWFGDDRLHASHRASLVRKDPDYYAPLFPDADPELPYYWPVQG